MSGNTPVYGFPYPEATDLVADYPALGQQLAEDIEDVLPTLGGLSPSTPTSIANSGGSASLSGNTVTFTGVSSVSLNGCFTGDYDNYRVLVTAAGSTSLTLQMRLRNAGSDNSSAVYDYQYGYFAASSVGGSRTLGATSAFFAYTSSASPNSYALDVYDVRSSNNKTINSYGSYRYSGGFDAIVHGVLIGINSAVDGFTILPNTGTITGTVSVYGYKK